MSVFGENSWEPNIIGDKLSKEMFQQKKKAERTKMIKRRKSGDMSHDQINRTHKNIQGRQAKKLITKQRQRKGQKAIFESVASDGLLSNKWARKPKINGTVMSTKSVKVQQNEGKPKFIPLNSTVQETKSQLKRRKLKLRKMTENQNIGTLNNGKSLDSTSKRKRNPMENIDLKRLETMLEAKTKTKNNKRKSEPESLRDRMMLQLRASRFRFLNETLYNSESGESKKYFKEDPEAFAAYHTGYKQQVEQWPLNPLDVVISSISKMPKDYVIADFGCGEARLAKSVSQKVHSFDLVAANDSVTACDMAHTTLLTSGVDVVVFCLSLMGTNLADYLLEANRVLKINGTMKIADIESRFENVDEFINQLKCYGFVNTWKDLSKNLFYFMDFKKISECNRNSKKLPHITLKSCLYKKR